MIIDKFTLDKLLKLSVMLPVLLAVSCSDSGTPAQTQLLDGPDNTSTTAGIDVAPMTANPFFTPSPLYLNYPPFDKIRSEHFLPAFEAGIAEQEAEVAAIARQQAEPTFANTIVALELSGQLLNRVSAVFFALAGADTNADIQALQQQLAPVLAAHDDRILFDADLFARISALYEQRDSMNLDAEQVRLLERYYTDFVRAGAALSDTEKRRMGEINAELALLQIQYNQNILDEMNASGIVVTDIAELDGLDPQDIATAASEAEAEGHRDSYRFPLVNTTIQPVIAKLDNRALRQRIQQTSEARGNHEGEFDNRGVLVDVLRLRAERAQLLGYESHADYVLQNQTAQTVAAVNQRLEELVIPAVANVAAEATALQAIIDDAGLNYQLASWDWSYYSEQLRAQRYNYDGDQLRPYFVMDNVLQRGVFYAAEKLYGITFRERLDLPVYHDDVRVFEVFDSVGTTLALFIADYYARPSKRGGAWNSSYIVQSDLLGSQPVMANHMNVAKPAAGQPTLLSFDEVITMFHEFGHALHVMFSAVEYPYFSGTRVPRDFVEFPSQVNEMWATWPEVLANYALHYETGAQMPAELVDKVLQAQQFNQGYSTVEYLGAAIIDQALHQLTPDTIPDAARIMDFEQAVLDTVNIDTSLVPPRYKATYFRHIMGGYAAGYYSYIWSEVLDADTVQWFRDNGGLQRRNGDHFRRTLLSRGGSVDAMQLFRDFRGRDARIEPLLNRRGLQ